MRSDAQSDIIIDGRLEVIVELNPSKYHDRKFDVGKYYIVFNEADRNFILRRGGVAISTLNESEIGIAFDLGGKK